MSWLDEISELIEPDGPGLSHAMPLPEPCESCESRESTSVTSTCAGFEGVRIHANSANSPAKEAAASPAPGPDSHDSHEFARSHDGPLPYENRPNSQDSHDSQGVAGTKAKSCTSCLHRTPARTCGEPVAAGLAPRFRVVFMAAIGEHGTSCTAWRFDPSKTAPASSASGPRLTTEQRDRLTGWTGEEIEQAGRYVALLTRRGLDAEAVERITDRLILRDREQDDRRLCLECARLDSSGRCGAAARGALMNADRRLEPLPLILQRCEGFEPAR